MPLCKKIMAAVDFSDYSAKTLACAVELAGDTGAELLVLNVINQRDVGAIKAVQQYVGDLDMEQVVAKEKQERLKKIDELLAETKVEGVKLVKEVRVGVPVQEILDCLRERRLDAIVMGTKGRTDLASTLFGSTAEKVFRHSPATVVSVRGL